MPDHPADQRGPQPGWAGGRPAAAEERDPGPVRPRAQPGQQRGQERQRAEHRDADHRDGADGDAGELAVPGEEQPAQRDHHGQPGDQDGPAGRGRRGAQRLLGARAAGPFLPLPAQVEQRVVDGDGHPDEQHDRGRAGVDGQPLPGDGEQGQRGEHRRPGQQHRDAGRDQRAEHRDQQDQRDRHRGLRSLPEVLAHDGVGGPVGARVPGFGNQQAGMAGRHRGHRAQRRHDGLVLLAGAGRHRERDQGAAPIGRDQPGAAAAERRGDIPRRVRQRGQRGRDLPGRAPHGQVGAERVPRPAAPPRLDQHVLVRRGGEAQPVQGLLGYAGLPGVSLRQILGRELVAGHENHGYQQEPAEHGGLAVPGTPPGDPLDHRCTGPVRWLANRFCFWPY